MAVWKSGSLSGHFYIDIRHDESMVEGQHRRKYARFCHWGHGFELVWARKKQTATFLISSAQSTSFCKMSWSGQRWLYFWWKLAGREPRRLSCYVFAMKEEKPSTHLTPSSIVQERGNTASFTHTSGHRQTSHTIAQCLQSIFSWKLFPRAWKTSELWSN